MYFLKPPGWKPKNAGILSSDLRKEWERIQKEKSRGKDIKNVLGELFQDKTKAYMTAFIKANSLPIPSKESKGKILQQLQSLLHVGATIIGR